jgi:FlaA1/EpsC-like NDP-sugar epimerase
LKLFTENTPRIIVLLADVSLCMVSLLLAYLLRFNFNIPPQDFADLPFVSGLIISTRIVYFLLFKTQNSIVRYTSTKDAQRIIGVIFLGSLTFSFINIGTFLLSGIIFIPTSILIIDFFTSSFLLVSARTIYKVLYYEFKNPSREKTPVIIFGASEAAVIAKRTLDRDVGTKYKAAAFIDPQSEKKNRKIEGVKVYPVTDYKHLAETLKPGFLIIAGQEIPAEIKTQVIEISLANNIRVLNVPPSNNWINGQLSFKQIKKISFEDLLERQEIKLDQQLISERIKNKTVLVTGGAGSIGSELVRQIMKFSPEKVVILDQAESPLYELELELKELFSGEKIKTIIGDIGNSSRIREVFKTHQPHIVFHAAAYKHVPLMEKNVAESVATNILGTKIVADCAHEYNCEVFVMISTDKAVNPIGVMGASKRVAEMYIQSLNQHSATAFITTRFGNVLGSNGSVIPIFRKQIEKGGPVKVTHPEITRYFMSISEACQLVLEASGMGKGGEIFIFDMGKPVKIFDLAKKMIKLYGLTLDKDIRIEFSGLREGEKLYEELLNNSENTLPTHHDKIMIARVNSVDFEFISHCLTQLSAEMNQENSEYNLIQLLNDTVPEYRPANG